jgi:hypothetical protein
VLQAKGRSEEGDVVICWCEETDEGILRMLMVKNKKRKISELYTACVAFSTILG